MPELIPVNSQLKPRGSAVATALLALFGWRVLFEGLPSKQGVFMVYPHTSNWDFVVGIMAKWATGLQVRFWAKNSLFTVPGFGRWLRWMGGVPVDRTGPKGLAGGTALQVAGARERDEFFWLAVTPEGTRSRAEGWRSGAYTVAVEAGVPVGLVSFDFESRTVDITQFAQVSGDAERDFALFHRVLSSARGKRPALASPVRLRR